MSHKIVVLVPDAGVASEVRDVAASRYWSAGGGVHVLVYERVEDTLAEARRLFIESPCAVVSRDAASALSALEAGADEALVLPSLDRSSVLELLDRAQARARVRIEAHRRQQSSAQTEKLSALGTLVAGVAHEINNPITAVLLSAEVLHHQLAPLFGGAEAIEGLVQRRTGASHAELVELLRTYRSGARSSRPALQVLSEMRSACEAIADIVRDLRIYARSGENEARELVRLPELIDKVVRLVGSDLARRAIIERDFDPKVPPILVPRTRLAQVLTNLLVNAAHAIAEVEREVHRVRISLRADEETILLSVSDTGPGIDPDVVERIFDPFFTTKRSSDGTGLGLSISRSIMQDLGGDLIVDSVHGDGATFVAWLPMPETAERDVSSVPPTARGQRVMVVEPDARVLSALARFLGGKHELILAADGQEAVELFASGSVPDVVVTDMEAVDATGRPLLAWLEEHRPTLCERVIVTVAHAELARDLGYSVLSKPIKPLSLLEKIETCVTAGRDAGLKLVGSN